MRVRGFWPFAEDRQISLPIPWSAWYHPDGEEGDEDIGAGGGVHSDDDLMGNPSGRGVKHLATPGR
jgi:hypothetical protein